jgi:fructosamine-3-kinase
MKARRAIELALGASFVDARPVSGGDINVAHAVTLDDGRRVFVKTNDDAASEMFPAEALGLAWLAEGGALRTPKVLAVSDPTRDRDAFLVLELIEPAPRASGFDVQLGRGLAALHQSGASSHHFGLDHDNFIGRLPQTNRPLPTWPDFYRERRLLPQLRMAERAGLASPAMKRGLARLCEVLEDRVGPAEPPARLHGDLWGGNLHVDERGAPCLIDPAAFAGHREVDLAMMKLFGGFSERTFAAYHEASPLSPEWEARVPLYQLYFLLAHVNLFGAGYVGAVERALAAVL